MLESFFPRINLDDPLFNMATVLVAGIISGELFARIRLPKVTGWIAVGIFLRWLQLPGLDQAGLQRFAPFNYFVLGYIAFTVGATLYFANLRNTEKRIGLLLLGEAIITPSIVAAALILLGPQLGTMSGKASVLLAAIAIAGAPGTTVLVIQEARARGILTRTILVAIGLIDMVAVAVFVFVSAFLSGDSDWLHSTTSVVVQFAVTFTIGATCASVALLLTRTVVGPAFLGPTMVALMLGSWGAASEFGTSGGILACTFAGITVTNLRHDLVRSTEAYLHAIGGVLFALFFTFAGMKLDFSQVPAAIGLVLLYFLARLIGKNVSSFTAMSLAGMPAKVRNYLGISLLPHGGVAVGLIILVQNDPMFQDVEGIITTVGLSALALNQLLGPSATRFAIYRAGEDHKDRPRLLDFLQEHRITVDLVGGTRDAVIKQMVSQLYATTPMDLPQGAFLDLVMQREMMETTCLGEGLMVPHAILDEGDEVKGVLGISSKGLDLAAPDGHLIHAVLLLATPATDRKRHLEILAAFATAITKDVNMREQLYHARSPAHAYEVLHAEDAEDLNYFLEDAIERAVIGKTSPSRAQMA
jgi:mannitol/fructose-specific phosphotransferase system IIA component (Ntr-type)/Kef-type K+ transport system membrane component KefB